MVVSNFSIAWRQAEVAGAKALLRGVGGRLESRGGGDFVGGARDRELADVLECHHTSPGKPRKACYAGQEWQERDVAEGYAVAHRSQRLEDWNFDAQGFAQVLLQFGLRMRHDLHGGELPQAGEQHVIVGAGILHEDRAALPIAENYRGDSDADPSALLAWRRDLLCQVESVGVAPTR